MIPGYYAGLGNNWGFCSEKTLFECSEYTAEDRACQYILFHGVVLFRKGPQCRAGEAMLLAETAEGPGSFFYRECHENFVSGSAYP